MIYTQLDPSYKYDVLADAIYSREVEYFHDANEVMVGMRLSNLLSHILWQKISKFFKEQKINVRKLLTRDPVGPGPHMTPGFECRRDMP